jgi:hypothetical protein
LGQQVAQHDVHYALAKASKYTARRRLKLLLEALMHQFLSADHRATLIISPSPEKIGEMEAFCGLAI